MLARTSAKRSGEGDLFARIGAFLRAQGLGPDPVNYSFAYQLLGRSDAEALKALERLHAEGIRLTRREIETMGGAVAAGAPAASSETALPARDEATDRLVAQTKAHVETAAQIMRTMHDETRGFGRDLAESAAAFNSRGEAASPLEIVRLTRAMIERATVTEKKLEQAAVETDALRAELAQAQETARRDPLTGLTNRRAFEEAFALPAGPRCLALCDIDRFKQINDGFGHAVGDRVLSAVARVLAEGCEGHLVSRLGGEEFGVLIDGGDVAMAVAMLDAARVAVGARRFRNRDTDAPIGMVSFSAGVVRVGANETADAALARADALLYRAKDEGRNRVIAG